MQKDEEAKKDDGESKGDQSKTHLDYEEAASQDPGDHDSLALPGGSMETMGDMLLEEEIQKEWKDFGDLVREDFVDSYQVNNLSRAHL